MYNTTKLKARIVEKFGSQNKFAEAIGVDKSVVSKCLNEGRDWKGSNLIKAMRVLEIGDSEVDSYFFTPAVKKTQPREV